MNAGLHGPAVVVYCTSTDSDSGSLGNDSGSATIYRDISIYLRVYAHRHLRFNIKTHKDYSAELF
jgi:hypothetical protein